MQKRTIIATLVAAAAIAVSGTTGAVAGSLVTSKDIKDSTIVSADIADGKIYKRDLSDGINEQLDTKATNGKDGANGVDGKNGKDGVSNLIVGAGYAGLGGHDYWAPNSYGETIETCPAGQYAIGGGFSQDASTGVDGKYDLGGKGNVQITVSAPYFKGEYVPVDEAGNFRADQWVVRGFNHGDSQVDVRAWVVCANVAD